MVIVSSYQFDQSCLNAFNLPEFIEAKEGWATQLREPLKIDSTTSFAAKQVPDILVKNHFGIHSYSALSRAHFAFPFEAEDLGDENSYDQFVFQDLKRGAKVGTAVHSIFEYLDFANPDSWDQTILDASKYYPNIIKPPRGQSGNLHHFKQMVEHVLGANITLNGTSFSLSQVSKSKHCPSWISIFPLTK